MPGRLFLTAPVSSLGRALDLPIDAIQDAPPRANIAPGQQVITLTEQGLVLMRWGIIPVGRVNARGRPVMETVINARSETVFDKSAFDGVGRAVVPANGWYEWTGEKRRKTAWRVRSKTDPFLYFAAITDVWHAPNGLAVPQVATVTCPPNKDVEKIHHRMGVLLRPQDIEKWLLGDATAVTPLMQPWPDGQLTFEKADDVDWGAP